MNKTILIVLLAAFTFLASTESEEKNKEKVVTHTNQTLAWFVSKQKNGYWKSANTNGPDTHDEDLLNTSFALLSFFYGGHTDRVGKYKKNVALGFKWLEAQIKKEGLISQRTYIQAICVMALSEASAMGCKVSKEKVKKSINFLLKQQHSNGYFHPYSNKNKKQLPKSLSTTTWATHALNTAMICKLNEKEIKKSFELTLKLKPKFKKLKSYNDLQMATTILFILGAKRDDPTITGIFKKLNQIPSKPYSEMDSEILFFKSYNLLSFSRKEFRLWRKKFEKKILKKVKHENNKTYWPPAPKGNFKDKSEYISTAIIYSILSIRLRGVY